MRAEARQSARKHPPTSSHPRVPRDSRARWDLNLQPDSKMLQHPNAATFKTKTPTLTGVSPSPVQRACHRHQFNTFFLGASHREARLLERVLSRSSRRAPRNALAVVESARELDREPRHQVRHPCLRAELPCATRWEEVLARLTRWMLARKIGGFRDADRVEGCWASCGWCASGILRPPNLIQESRTLIINIAGDVDRVYLRLCLEEPPNDRVCLGQPRRKLGPPKPF